MRKSLCVWRRTRQIVRVTARPRYRSHSVAERDRPSFENGQERCRQQPAIKTIILIPDRRMPWFLDPTKTSAVPPASAIAPKIAELTREVYGGRRRN